MHELTLKTVIKKKDDKTITAYHEAGHAVTYIITNARFEFVTIKPDYEKETSGGLHSILSTSDWYVSSTLNLNTKIQFLVLECVRIMAGPISEKIYSGLPIRKSTTDYKKTKQAIKSTMNGYTETIDLFWAFIMSYTTNLLKDNWSLVEAVANALLEKETLSLDEVGNICDPE